MHKMKPFADTEAGPPPKPATELGPPIEDPKNGVFAYDSDGVITELGPPPALGGMFDEGVCPPPKKLLFTMDCGKSIVFFLFAYETSSLALR
jgi:hypothetical protein